MDNKSIQLYSNPLIINTKDYDYLVNKLREFFKSKNFVEISRQNRLSILATYKDQFYVGSFNYTNATWPLAQTGQMWLEYEILKNPEIEGFFCLTTSYRLEKNPLDGIDDIIFRLFEFETHGNVYDLVKLERELLKFLGYKKEDIKMATYEEMQEKYEVEELEHKDEEKMETDIGKAVLLHDFPEHTYPFWNMKRDLRTNTVRKIDVILTGEKTICSGEREDNKYMIKRNFETIMDGKYKEKLYELFGEERTNKELEDYLNLNFFDRIGGGINIDRLIRSMKKENLINILNHIS